jgi:hypothetical protein
LCHARGLYSRQKAVERGTVGVGQYDEEATLPRNFDELLNDDDLEFIIGGEKFTMIYVRPEVLAAIAADADDADDKPFSQTLADNDAQIKLFLRPEDHERWDALRAREENPVTQRQLNELITYLVEVQTGRPTLPPSPSPPGAGATAPTSSAAPTPAGGSRRQTVRPSQSAR